MTSEDSVWCCLWSSYCTPPQPVASRYLNYSIIITSLSALALVLMLVRRKHTETNFPKKTNAIDGAFAADDGDALKSNSFSKMKTFLKKVVSQTNRCMAHGDRSGKSIDSLEDVRRLADEFMRKADRKRQKRQRGQMNADDGSLKASPPPPPPPPPSPPSNITAQKKLQSASN